MKASTILIGAAAAVGAYIVYVQFIKPQTVTPGQQVAQGVSGLINGAGSLWSGLKGVFGGSSSSSSSSTSSSPQVAAHEAAAPELGGIDLSRSAYQVRVPNLGFGRTSL